mmetsp:Transcript_37357/g.93735  ORF Transcript_37357/g.93735 Transcript_37357/m.93735 type:complete len:193 (-) Transcript_37357:313-891(-)
MLATMNGHEKVVISLLSLGADPTKTDDTALTSAMSLAAQHGRLRIFKMLVNRANARADFNIDPLYFPLCHAASNGHYNVAHNILSEKTEQMEKDLREWLNTPKGIFLTAFGASIHDAHDEYTPLMYAIRGGSVNLVREMFEMGANLDDAITRKYALHNDEIVMQADLHPGEGKNLHTSSLHVLAENGNGEMA